MTDRQSTTESPAQASERETARVRPRAFVVVAGLLVATVWYAVWGTWQTGGVGPIGPMFGPAIAVLFFLSLANREARRRRPGWAFRPGELVLIYVTVATAGMASGVYTWFGPLASVIVHPIWGATPSDQWTELMWPNLAPWLTVTDLS